jgi:hypothetical protein
VCTGWRSGGSSAGHVPLDQELILAVSTRCLFLKLVTAMLEATAAAAAGIPLPSSALARSIHNETRFTCVVKRRPTSRMFGTVVQRNDNTYSVQLFCRPHTVFVQGGAQHRDFLTCDTPLTTPRNSTDFQFRHTRNTNAAKLHRLSVFFNHRIFSCLQSTQQRSFISVAKSRRRLPPLACCHNPGTRDTSD